MPSFCLPKLNQSPALFYNKMTTVNQPEIVTAATRALSESGVCGSPSKMLMQGLRFGASNQTILRILRDSAGDTSVGFGAQVDDSDVFESLAGYVAHAISVSVPGKFRGFDNCCALVLFGRVNPAIVIDILNKAPGGRNFVSHVLEVQIEFGIASSIHPNLSKKFVAYWRLSAAMRVARAGGLPADPTLVLAVRQAAAQGDHWVEPIEYDACRSIAEYIDDLVEWIDQEKTGLNRANADFAKATEQQIQAGNELTVAIGAWHKAAPERIAQKLKIFSTAENQIEQAAAKFSDGFDWSNQDAAQDIAAAYDQAARDVKELLKENWGGELTLQTRQAAVDRAAHARAVAAENVKVWAGSVRIGEIRLAEARLAYANTPAGTISAAGAAGAAPAAAAPAELAPAEPAEPAPAAAEPAPAAPAAAEPAPAEPAPAEPAPAEPAAAAAAVADPDTVAGLAGDVLGNLVAQLREMLTALTALTQ